MIYFILFGIGAVVLVLILGLVNMARGGSPRRAQILMRWRIGLQLIFVFVLAAAMLILNR